MRDAPLSSVFVFSSADPLLATVHFRSLLFNDFTFLLSHAFQVLVAAFWTRSCNVSCFCHTSSMICSGLCRLFSVPSPPVLPLPFCHELFPPRLASLPPLYLVRYFRGTRLPLPFVNGLQCPTIRLSPSSVELSLSSFTAIPISIGALVSTFFCLMVVDDDVFQQK